MMYAALFLIGLTLASLPASAQVYVDSQGRPLVLSGKAMQPLVTGGVGVLARPAKHHLKSAPAPTKGANAK